MEQEQALMFNVVSCWAHYWATERVLWYEKCDATSGTGVGLERVKRAETKLSVSKQILDMMESYVAICYWELTLSLSYVPVKAFGQTSKPVRYLIITIYTRYRIDGRCNLNTEK